MVFNISDMLKKKFLNNEEFVQKNEIYLIIKNYIDLTPVDVVMIRGIISLKNISPTARVQVKKNKNKILFELKEKDIFVRDII